MPIFYFNGYKAINEDTFFTVLTHKGLVIYDHFVC
jgi:hypothetical protein